VFRDLSDLPREQIPRASHDMPAPLVELLMAEWARLDEDSQTRPMADVDARVRHSWAGMCAHRIGLAVGGEEPSDPLTLGSLWRFAVGRAIHTLWQPTLAEALKTQGWTDVTVELPLLANVPLASGHADLCGVDPDGYRTMFECKSVNGYGYKMIVGAVGDEAGPRESDFLQGAVNADAYQADRLVIFYVSLETIGEKIAERAGFDELTRYATTFTYDRPDWEAAASRERGRWDLIVSAVDAGLPVPRVIPGYPDGAVIVDPSRGRWEISDINGYVTDSGTAWQCNYCPYQTLCPSTP
jgi:hypothetical protein